jgi:hypothetical protein
MNLTTKANLLVQLAAGILIGAILLVLILRPQEKTPAPMHDWRIEDLIEQLHSSGLRLRAVGTMQDGHYCDGVYLTTTDQTWEDLNQLSSVAEKLADWKGTVYCRRLTNSPDAGRGMIEIWGAGGERLGPFALFGDPKLRAKIRQAVLSIRATCVK